MLSLMLSLKVLKGVFLGGVPDGKAERNLVDEVSKVVDQIKLAILDTTHQIPKEVACRVDRPTDRDDEAHGGEGGRNVLAHTLGHSPGFTVEDLVEDVDPAAHAKDKARPWVDE